MKRLLLLGGRPWTAADGGKSFTDALFRPFPKDVKLAFCIFAQPETEWGKTTTWNTSMFDAFKAPHQISYKTMTAENFSEVSKWADIIYIPGGDPFILLEKISTQNDITNLWDNKMVAGASAGADILCKNFIYLQDKRSGQGLGWVNATCIPHWQNYEGYTSRDWDQVEAESIQQFPDVPVLCIPEGEFTAFSVT